MEFRIGKGSEIQVLLVFKAQKTVIKENGLYTFLKEKDLFKGNTGEVFTNIFSKEEKVIFLGLGEKEKLTIDDMRKSFYNLGKELIKFKIETVDINISGFNFLSYNHAVAAVVEGLLQSEYKFQKYLTEKKVKPCVKEVYLEVEEGKKDSTLELIKETEIIMKGVVLARELVNEPAINMYPEKLGKLTKSELESSGVIVEVFGIKEIEELKMEAFLSVSEGSNKEPKFIVMTYNGDSNSDDKLALVGKGITYDSGGYSIKSTENMKTMFTDMAGSAAVIGAMKSIADNKLKKNVVGIVAACENLISGGAYKPGDIIGSMSGKTIEVVNTDAEGRLTLADALWYAATVVKANKIVDLATLTYSCVAALGDIYSGAIANNNNLMSQIKKASELAGEPIWELPSNDKYKKLNKSEYADLINDSDLGAGVISAGLFLGEFVNNIPWVHLDIAGTSYNESIRDYLPKGATGIHVKTLYELVKGLKY